MHGEGDGRGQLQLFDLLPPIARDKLNGRLHFGYHSFGFIDAIETPLTEMFLLSNGANCLDLSADIGGDELAVSPHATFEVDKVIGLADGLKTLFDLLSLLAQPLVFLAGRCERLLGLLKTHRFFRGTTRPALLGWLVCALKTSLDLIELLLGLFERLISCSLFGCQARTHRLAEFLLDMEQVG